MENINTSFIRYSGLGQARQAVAQAKEGNYSAAIKSGLMAGVPLALFTVAGYAGYKSAQTYLFSATQSQECSAEIQGAAEFFAPSLRQPPLDPVCMDADEPFIHPQSKEDLAGMSIRDWLLKRVELGETEAPSLEILEKVAGKGRTLDAHGTRTIYHDIVKGAKDAAVSCYQTGNCEDACESAQLAYGIRAAARQYARERGPLGWHFVDEARDAWIYGVRTGPTFEFLLEKNKGSCERIVDSSITPNKYVDAMIGVEP